MPKLVCTKCQVELKPETNGVKVIEMASFGPYKIWNADLWKCRGCGLEIVSGFAHEPIAEHFQPTFPQELEKIVGGKIYYDFERPQ